MSIKAPIYSCYQCREVVTNLQDLLFVEENSTKGFCSEKCIEQFYSPLLNHYETKEIELRKKYQLEDEAVVFGLNDEEMMKRLIESPDEVWCLTNGLGEETYAYFKFLNRGCFIVICTSYKGEPSYIFSTIKTADERLIAEYRIGEIKLIEERVINDLEEVVERKKSEILATIIEAGAHDDIGMDKYIEYDKFFEETMRDADEIYEQKDKHGDVLITYIKAYRDLGEAIFYLVICLKSDSPSLKSLSLKSSTDAEGDLMTIFPIMAFPTRSALVYKEFKQGKLLSGHLSN